MLLLQSRPVGPGGDAGQSQGTDLTAPRGRIGYWPMGVFGGRNYTSTTGLDGTETAITQVGPHPPLSYASQGSTP